ncbi:MAG: DALR domain-containing protein, partial [Patescibacteria group bacterium]
VHTGVVTVGNTKMSKSLGNFITGKEMIDHNDPDAFRFMVVSRLYRSPLPYSEKLLTQAKQNLETIRDFARRLKQVKARAGTSLDIASYHKQFFARMDDDFNTPSALAVIFTLMRKANTLMKQEKLSAKDAKQALAFLKEVENIIGVPLTNTISTPIPQAITALAKERNSLRTQGKWAEADGLRARISEQGYIVKDTKDGFEIIPRGE